MHIGILTHYNVASHGAYLQLYAMARVRVTPKDRLVTRLVDVVPVCVLAVLKSRLKVRKQ